MILLREFYTIKNVKYNLWTSINTLKILLYFCHTPICSIAIISTFAVPSKSLLQILVRKSNITAHKFSVATVVTCHITSRHYKIEKSFTSYLIILRSEENYTLHLTIFIAFISLFELGLHCFCYTDQLSTWTPFKTNYCQHISFYNIVNNTICPSAISNTYLSFEPPNSVFIVEDTRLWFSCLWFRILNALFYEYKYSVFYILYKWESFTSRNIIYSLTKTLINILENSIENFHRTLFYLTVIIRLEASFLIYIYTCSGSQREYSKHWWFWGNKIGRYILKNNVLLTKYWRKRLRVVLNLWKKDHIVDIISCNISKIDHVYWY